MTPEKKAEQLRSSFYDYSDNRYNHDNAIDSAMLCVTEIIEALYDLDNVKNELEYWGKVLTELSKLR